VYFIKQKHNWYLQVHSSMEKSWRTHSMWK